MVNVEDEVGLAAIEVDNLMQGRSGSARNKCRSRGPVVSGQKNHLITGARLTEFIYGKPVELKPAYPAERMAVTTFWTDLAQRLIFGIS